MGIHQVVPYGAMVVLKTLCEAIVDSPELGVYRPPARLGDAIEIALAARLGRVGAEQQVAEDLDALIQGGLVIDEGGCWTVPVDLPGLMEGQPVQARFRSPSRPPARWADDETQEGSRRAVSSRENGMKGGRPPKRVAGQRELDVHGLVTGSNRPVTGTQTETQRETQASEVEHLGSGDNLDGFVGSPLSRTFLPSLPVVENPESSDLSGRKEGTVTDAALACADDQPGFQNNPAETQAGETQTQAPPVGQVARIVEMEVLALDVGGILGLPGGRGTRGPDLMAEWLALPGMDRIKLVSTAKLCRSDNDALMARAPGTQPIGSFDFCDRAMRAAVKLPPKPRPAHPAVAAAAAGSGSALPAHINTSMVPDAAKGLLAGALAMARQGQDAKLSECLRRLTLYPVAVRILRAEVEDLDARIAVAGGSRRRFV